MKPPDRYLKEEFVRSVPRHVLDSLLRKTLKPGEVYPQGPKKSLQVLKQEFVMDVPPHILNKLLEKD